MARIALVTISMDKMAGGLERNIVYLANHLSSAGHEVLLLTFDLPGASSFYPLGEVVIWHCLGRTPPHSPISSRERLQLILRMRKALGGPEPCEFMICFHHGILARSILAALFSRTRVVCSERNALSIYDYIQASKWNLNFLLLFLVHRITVQFSSYRADYPRLLQSKIYTVHNPVFPLSLKNSVREHIILSVGRHCAQKRFDLLIKACGRSFEKNPSWRLVIIGDGPLTSSLQTEIESAALTDRVMLVPPTNDLQQWFSRATLYCQPSQWEGFPNAQAEAMAAGVIPLGFTGTSGVADLITDGVNGYLCERESSAGNLSRCLAKAMTDTARHARLSQAAREICRLYSSTSWEKCWAHVLGFQDSDCDI